MVPTLLLLSETSIAQTALIDDLAEKDEYSALYFYPSTLRMLSKILGGEQGAVFSEIKRARIIYTWEDDEILSKEITRTAALLEKDGFENIMSMRSQGNDINALLLESKIPIYVFTMAGAGGVYLMEIQGKLSISSLQAIATMNPAEAFEFLDLKSSEEAAVEIEKPTNTDEK